LIADERSDAFALGIELCYIRPRTGRSGWSEALRVFDDEQLPLNAGNGTARACRDSTPIADVRTGDSATISARRLEPRRDMCVIVAAGWGMGYAPFREPEAQADVATACACCHCQRKCGDCRRRSCDCGKRSERTRGDERAPGCCRRGAHRPRGR